MKPKNVSSFHWFEYNLLIFIEHILGKKLYKKIFTKIEKRFFTKIDNHLSKINFQDNKADSIVEEYTLENAESNFYHPHKVRVYRGAAKDWVCTQKWNFDYFSKEFGKQIVTLFSNEGLLAKDSEQDFNEITLDEYITLLKSGSKKYLKFSRVIDENSVLKNEINNEFLLKFTQKGSFGNLFYFFMGGKGTSTPIHNGLQPTVFIQIQGIKKWKFLPTGDRLFLNVRANRTNYFYSGANLSDLNDPDYPLLKYAKPEEVTLYPGDVLYFPSLVWHQVENETDSIGVAYKFVHLPSAYKSSKMMTLLFFLATKPFLPYATLMIRLKKKDPVFLKKNY